MYTVAALYKFSSIEDPNNLQIAVRKKLKQLKIYGTILLGNEGLNGTISGQDDNLKDAIEFISSKLKDTKNNSEFFNSMNKPG